MIRLLFAFREAVIAAIFLIPLFWYLNKIRFRNPKHTVLYALLAIYLAGMYAVVGLPNVTYIRFDPNVNFAPFRYMFSDLVPTVLNILLFVPLGCFLTMLWKPMRNPKWNLLFGFLLSLLIETLQIFSYRATDVNDLITNSLGTLIGWTLGMVIMRCFPALKMDSRKQDIGVVFSAALGVMFFFHPFLASIF